MKTLTLSIVIPVFNEEEHLNNCLQSIASQSIMPDVVIVVDNNSSDRSVNIASQFPFVKVISEKHQGIAYARDAGFNYAKTDLIGRLDADTVLPSNWVESIKDLYKENQDFAFTGGGYFYNVSLKGFNSWMLSQLAFRANRFIMGHYILWGSNMVIPREYWQEVKNKVCSTNSKIHEDLDLAIHLHQLAHSILYKEDIKVGVEMKRAFDKENTVFKANLAMWPETLRIHYIKRAWLGSVGAGFLYYGTVIVMRPADKIIKTFKTGGRQLRSLLSSPTDV